MGTNILGDQKKGLRAPVTAIRNGETDGNPATTGDPTWSSFIVTPPFPDYVSGHATFSGAAAKVLALFYGTDAIAFTTGSDFLPGVTRSFTSCSGAAAEAAVSRIYGGHSLPLRERGRDGVGCAHRRLGLRQHAAAEGEQVEEVAAAQRRSARALFRLMGIFQLLRIDPRSSSST